MKIKVYYLVSDTHNSGTECDLFATEPELLAALVSIIKDDDDAMQDDAVTALLHIDPDPTEQAQATNPAPPSREEILEAWDLWSDGLRYPLDTYDWGDYELDVRFSPEDAAAVACDTFGDIPPRTIPVYEAGQRLSKAIADWRDPGEDVDQDALVKDAALDLLARLNL